MQEHLGKTIKKYRQMNSMTQKELAAMIHVEHSTISNWELGKRKVDLETARHLSEILGFSLDDLSESENHNIIYQSIEHRNFKHEIQKKYIVFKLVIILFFIGLSWTIFSGDIGFVSIFLVLFVLIVLYDIFLLFKPKVDVDYYQVQQRKKVYVKKQTKHLNVKKRFRKKICTFIIYYLVLMVYLSLSLTFLYSIVESSIYVYISSIFILSILFFMIIYREFRLWNTKTSFDYKQFQYKKDLILYRLLVIVFDGIIMYSLSITAYYLSSIADTRTILFLLSSSILYLGMGYDLYIGKLVYLSDFSLNYE